MTGRQLDGRAPIQPRSVPGGRHGLAEPLHLRMIHTEDCFSVKDDREPPAVPGVWASAPGHRLR